MGKKSTFEDFVSKATLKHNGFYTYPDCDYKNTRSIVPIYCPVHDGLFYQQAKYHLRGNGCNICRTRHTSKHKESLQNVIIDGEIWRDITDYEGLYQVSNFGRLRTKSNGEWVIRSNVNSKGGYFSVILSDKSRKRSCRMHRLVYETFVGEIPKGFYIHHINGDKQDNRVENLMLVNPKEHSKEHYIDMLINRGVDISTPQPHLRYLVKDGVVLGDNPNYDPNYNPRPSPKNRAGRCVTAKHRRIAQYGLDGTFIAEYETARDAYFETGVCARNILQVANQTPYNDKGFTRKQAGGYIWKFAN